MEEKLKTYMEEALSLREVDIRTYSPLTLAYIGDAVYELIIRTLVINHGNMPVNKLHKKSSSLVKASAQAQMIQDIEELLTQEERAVYRRGRNAKSVTMAKNATMSDYRMATGMEALTGYLYLTNQQERLLKLLAAGLRKMGELN